MNNNQCLINIKTEMHSWIQIGMDFVVVVAVVVVILGRVSLEPRDFIKHSENRFV